MNSSKAGYVYRLMMMNEGQVVTYGNLTSAAHAFMPIVSGMRATPFYPGQNK